MAKKLIIKNISRVYTMSDKDAQVREDVDILISNGKIEKIGRP